MGTDLNKVFQRAEAMDFEVPEKSPQTPSQDTESSSSSSDSDSSGPGDDPGKFDVPDPRKKKNNKLRIFDAAKMSVKNEETTSDGGRGTSQQQLSSGQEE